MLRNYVSCSAPTHRRQGFHQVRDDATRQAATRGVVQEAAHSHITTCVYIIFTMRLHSFPFHLQCVCNRLHHVDIAFAQTLGIIQKRCKNNAFSVFTYIPIMLTLRLHVCTVRSHCVTIYLHSVYIAFTQTPVPMDLSHE